MKNNEKKIKLSVVIIIFNEENNIKRCIENIKDIADEIVIVDSFSTDRTKEICSLYKEVKFIEHKFEGYTKQKNWAILQATSNYVLSIDADEIPDDILKKSIIKVKNNWGNPGYSMNRLTNYCGKWIKHCGWYPDVKLRLFDTNYGNWTGINIHEEYKFFDKNIKAIKLEGNLLHYSYNSISQHILQIDKFTNITSQEAFEKNKKTSLIGIFFRTYWKFFRDFFIKLGFKDGYYGFIICTLSSFATFFKYIKLKELYKHK